MRPLSRSGDVHWFILVLFFVTCPFPVHSHLHSGRFCLIFRVADVQKHLHVEWDPASGTFKVIHIPLYYTIVHHLYCCTCLSKSTHWHKQAHWSHLQQTAVQQTIRYAVLSAYVFHERGWHWCTNRWEHAELSKSKVILLGGCKLRWRGQTTASCLLSCAICTSCPLRNHEIYGNPFSHRLLQYCCSCFVFVAFLIYRRCLWNA